MACTVCLEELNIKHVHVNELKWFAYGVAQIPTANTITWATMHASMRAAPCRFLCPRPMYSGVHCARHVMPTKSLRAASLATKHNSNSNGSVGLFGEIHHCGNTSTPIYFFFSAFCGHDADANAREITVDAAKSA